MTTEQVIVCGVLADGHLADGHLADGHLADGHLADGHQADGHQADPAARVLALNLWAGQAGGANVVLRIEELPERWWRPVPAQFADLLEIAAYVYCADQATARGQMDADTFGSKWRRQFHFHIPVRVPELWNAAEVKAALGGTLSFLSDDCFAFTFYRAQQAPGMEQYLDAGGGVLADGHLADSHQADSHQGAPEQVVMFSGGLDAVAGAVEECLVQKRRIVLVNHRPRPKLHRLHRELQRLLAEQAKGFAPAHLQVRIHKDSDLNQERTQRTRSFLYVALGATVAMMLGQRSVRFYENGVASLNLPVCAQGVGGRAARTTHPQVLEGFRRLLTLVAGAAFLVENPFIWETKGEVIGRMLRAGAGALIEPSVSCAHPWEMTKEFTHCGNCSQCIDRRFGIVAAGAEGFDAAGHYQTDVFAGSRSTEEDKTMLATYLERANQVRSIQSAAQLIGRYPEVVRVFRCLPGGPAVVAERVLDLYRRHGNEVNAVVEKMLARHLTAIRQRTLPADCLLRTVYESGSVTTVPAHGNGEAAAALACGHQATGAMAAGSTRGQKTRANAGDGPPPARAHRLRKSQGVWVLGFEGGEEILQDDRGIALVDYLLKHPPEAPIHATSLEARVEGNPDPAEVVATVPNSASGGSVTVERRAVVQEASGGRLSGGTGVLLRRKLSELKAEMEDETLPQSQREEAQAEYAELLSAAGRGGKMLDAAGRSAERVRKAIKRLLDGLKGSEVRPGVPNKTLRRFAEHLEQQLWVPSVGVAGGLGGRRGAMGAPGRFIYVAPPGVVWRE